MTKHIAGTTDYWELKIGDIVLDKFGIQITGKGKGICLDGKWAQYDGNDVHIQVETPMGRKKQIILSKKEIKLLLRNFKDSR